MDERKVILEKKQGAMVQLVQDLGKFFKKKDVTAKPQ